MLEQLPIHLLRKPKHGFQLACTPKRILSSSSRSSHASNKTLQLKPATFPTVENDEKQYLPTSIITADVPQSAVAQLCAQFSVHHQWSRIYYEFDLEDINYNAAEFAVKHSAIVYVPQGTFPSIPCCQKTVSICVGRYVQRVKRFSHKVLSWEYGPCKEVVVEVGRGRLGHLLVHALRHFLIIANNTCRGIFHHR